MFRSIIRWAYYILFALVPLIFLPITSELFEFNKIILTYLLTSVIVAAWITQIVVEKKWIFKRTALDWPLLIFLGSQLLSWVFSIDQHVSWYGYYSRWNGGILSLVSYAILYWGFVTFMDAKSTMRALKAAMGAAVAVCIWATLEHFGHSPSCLVTTGTFDDNCWVQDVQTRVFATLGQPNWLAAYIAALIFIPMSSIIASKKSRWLSIITFVLLFATLLFTKSRSGLLAFGLSSVIYWGISFWHSRRKSLAPFALFLALTLILTLTVRNPIKDLVLKTRSESSPAVGTQLDTGGTESGSIRKIVWTGALRVWRGSAKNFWLGTGPETFAESYYQYRPIEHNSTSEWELLYNKAHNEFLNYLATTGILGLVSYLLLLGAMAWILFKHRNPVSLALFAGWLTIPVTNFWGFSVVIIQILLVLLPAMAISLQTPEHAKNDPLMPPWVLVLFLVVLAPFVYLSCSYWIADTLYSAGQKEIKYFQSSQNTQYLLLAQQSLISAYKINKSEPAIAADLSNASAYLSLAALSQATDSARQLADLAVAASDQALNTSPYHPNYYKSRARSFILLSDLDPKYLQMAADALSAAIKISPTDPRLPFNLGVVDKFLGKNDEAKIQFQKALELKPDFSEPRKQLEEMASVSAKTK